MRTFFFVWILFLYQQQLGATSNDCVCPEIKCNSCEKVEGLDFYTTKCAGGAKLMSCAKQKCSPLEDPPASCLAKNEKEKRDVAAVPEKMEAPLNPVSFQDAQVEIGEAEVVNGSAWVFDANKKKQDLKPGMRVYESDTIATGSDGQVKVVFKDSNELHITPSSKVELSQYNASENIKKRRALLHLLRGKIRSKVKKKYDDKGTSFYRVKTKSAVAGVRGTDFVVGYEIGQQENTKVETLKGEVQLSDPSQDQKVQIAAGQYASYVVKSRGVFSDDEVSEFIQKGYLTPVYRLSANEMKDLDEKTKVIASHTDEVNQRGLSSTGQKKAVAICDSPQAGLNQCAWFCQGNPKGEKVCRVDLPQVKCVRKRCNANGAWAEESRVPASEMDYCENPDYTVRDCDY